MQGELGKMNSHDPKIMEIEKKIKILKNSSNAPSKNLFNT